MSINLKLQPFSAKIEQTKSISFVISGLDNSKKYRISFENATLSRNLVINKIDRGSFAGEKIFIEKCETVKGEVNLSLFPSDSVSIISVYANIEEQVESGAWRLSDIAAFSFQIENAAIETTSDKVSVYPVFVGPEERATIKVNTNPNSNIQVIVNNKRFIIKSNYSGEGSISFRAIDILSGTETSSKAVQKFAVTYSLPKDNHKKIYDSGTFLHFVPENIKALQSTNTTSAPVCAVIDPSPGSGLTIQKQDNFCIEGAVIGPLSIFDKNDESGEFYNSQVGFCSSLKQAYPISGTDAVCRIYNSTSSTLLSDGSALVAFASQETFISDPYTVPNLASKIFIAGIPTSLKYKGNPVRNGSILKPAKYYHTATPSSIKSGETYSLLFRIDDGSLFEIRYDTVSDSIGDFIAYFVEIINNNSIAQQSSIIAINQETFIEVTSENRFSIVASVIVGEGSFVAKLRSNSTLNLLTDADGVLDSGNTVVFLFPPIGYQSHKIISRDLENNIIRIDVPDGFNNEIGPNVFDNIYCQKFVVVDKDTSLSVPNLTQVNPLPYVYDIFNREVSSIYPVITSRVDFETSKTLVYVVCQAPVDGVYQLFFYSFVLGESPEDKQWKQLTKVGENKNAKIRCDSIGNLHIVWESDRFGATQLFYSVLGPSSRLINNQMLMSFLDKTRPTSVEQFIYEISDPTALQSSWKRILSDSGKSSIISDSVVVVKGNPYKDTSLAAFTLSTDEVGNTIPDYFSQLSFQVSFDLDILGITTDILSDSDIQSKYEEWVASFTPVGEYKYEKNGNFFTLDNYGSYFDTIIPICGSYNLLEELSTTQSGGSTVSGYTHSGANSYCSMTKEATLTHPSKVRHFMLAVIPEKIKFRAKNTEALFQYCERLDLSSVDCEGFENEIEEIVPTGRFKLALFLATSDNESVNEVARKKFSITRVFGDFIDFKTSNNIKVAVHYGKMGSDYLSRLLKRDKQAFANEHRFSGDILISVNDEIKLAQSFLADFSDSYNKFDIGLGMLYGQALEFNESVPYKNNQYENLEITQIFTNIAIGPHSIKLKPEFCDMSSFDRNTKQIVVPEQISSIISNGSFDSSVLPFSLETNLYDGYVAIDSWIIGHGAIYRKVGNGFISSTSVGYRPSTGPAWIELTGQVISSIVYKGSISQSLTTVPGKEYTVFFDLSNSPLSYAQGSFITKKVKVTAASSSQTFSTTIESSGPSVMNWKTNSFSFVAASSTTNLIFSNESNQFGDVRDIEYGPQIDHVLVVEETDLSTTTSSINTFENLMISKDEFDVNYSLNATDDFTQISITFSETYQNKHADLFIDKADKSHLAWQSNRNGYWDIYYTGSRNRGSIFLNEIRITESKSNSLNPSIAVDSKGRRLIAWQDYRLGLYQIFSAISKEVDESLVDQCKQDEVDDFLYSYNSSLDPYFDFPVSQLSCSIEFEFNVLIDATYHFSLHFYEDSEYKTFYKTISSSTSINGWRVDGLQLSYSGLTASSGAYVISYNPSKEDELSNRVLYVVVEFEKNVKPIDLSLSTNVAMVEPYVGLDLRVHRYQVSSSINAILEFDDISPVVIKPQPVTSLQYPVTESTLYPFTDMTFDSPLVELPGVAKGDKVRSVLLHYDPPGGDQTIESTITFTSPIAALFVIGNTLFTSKPYFGFNGVLYQDTTGAGLTQGNAVRVSADRKTITLNWEVTWFMRSIRVILENDNEVIGTNQFAYYCPTTQAARCAIDCNYINNSIVAKNVNFRVTFYVDPEKTVSILSSLTSIDNFGWKANRDAFPSIGISVEPGLKATAVFEPEVMPFELYESSNSESSARQSLLCGVTYYVTVESYVDGIFTLESQVQFTCPCSQADATFSKKNTDVNNWICSGQGFDDFRITQTDNNCMFPKVCVTDFNMFNIIWQDYRFTRTLDNQPSLSPDYFAALYNADTDVFYCSAQGGYDRRLTSYNAEAGRVLYDASVFLDQFQNINLVTHDGQKLFTQSCTFGCDYIQINPDVIKPCMFTDQTDSTLFVIGGTPDRDVDQYQKIRIQDRYVNFSTYIDLQTPISVINDCFIQLDIIGVPGTYAFRLKNENDQDWSEWLPIGPDLPAQTQTDSSTTSHERNFFRAYFTQKNRFIAPWVTSSGNGIKKVCCEVLTFFGKTESFCVDFMAIYDDLEYKIDLFFDETFTKPVPKFKNYMIASNKKTETTINDSNLNSITEDVSSVQNIYARIEFKDKQKIQLIEKVEGVTRFGLSSKITMNVYQQGTNDQLGIELTKVDSGIYKGVFLVSGDDGVINVDGLAIITIDVPGQCKPILYSDLSKRSDSIISSNSLDQKVSVFNNFSLFREKYLGDDIKGSFGSPDYYKLRTFGINETPSTNNAWIGGGNNPLNNDTGYTIIPPG